MPSWITIIPAFATGLLFVEALALRSLPSWAESLAASSAVMEIPFANAITLSSKAEYVAPARDHQPVVSMYRHFAALGSAGLTSGRRDHHLPSHTLPRGRSHSLDISFFNPTSMLLKQRSIQHVLDLDASLTTEAIDRLDACAADDGASSQLGTLEGTLV